MSPARRRGQPLAALGIVLVAWVGLRAAAWTPPFAIDAAEAQPRPMQSAAPAMPALRAADTTVALMTPQARAATPAVVAAAAAPIRAASVASVSLMPMPVTAPPTTSFIPAPIAPELGSHRREPIPVPRALAATPGRWSGDGWVLVRGGAGGLGSAAGTPAYGASQAGGVVRFALAPASALAPQAFVRVARALGSTAEGEVAAGLAAQPLAAAPVRLAGEVRVQRSGGTTRVRPAASLITALAPQRLPLGVEAEAYVQAGYVAGRDATPFFDAQAVAERKLTEAGPATVTVGAGAWGGGQDGAARLDVGPRAAVRLRMGETASRLALDWRFRIAGRARPGSGPALTLSTGF